MAEDQDRKSPHKPLRAFGNLFRRAVTPRPEPEEPEPPAKSAPAGAGGSAPAQIGPYVVTGEIGRGGMGIVYAARDPRLERTVAIKTMASPRGDEDARKRFWREARAAASVNHPNICQIYEIGEQDGQLYLAMELLEGEPLSDRLRDGAMTVTETIPIGLGILAALAALHSRSIIHRDLKPSNVFLTPHGVKLLDFGLARPIPPVLERASLELTRSGMVLGTPRYIAPEQVTGEPIDERSDLFAVGVILFEMLAGRPAFNGNNVIEVMHATVHEQPPALTGSPAVIAVDRVIRRAIAKRPAERPPSADAMAQELRGVETVTPDESAPAMARTLTRLVVLPFRMLRPDPETDFLTFSLPDAIATSLTGFGSLIVRSTTTAARFAGDAPDLKAVAAEADVDRVVMGSLLRSGDQLRATAQLVEAPGGTLLTSHTATSSMGDLFRLQDDLARRIVDGLALPLAGPPSTPDVPHDARAYALYLEAKALARNYEKLPAARELYERCVELDPRFAPAWAELGRALRVTGKFAGGPPDSWERAEEALRRALELNPRLSVAHKYYAHLESDTGHSLDALVRLLDEAVRHGNDPELFAGLVHACRYCGLYEQSVAAHEEARRLDPKIATSLAQTLLMKGDLDRLLALADAGALESGDAVIRVVGSAMAGRREEARKVIVSMRQDAKISAFRVWADFLTAWLDRRPEEMLAHRSALGDVKVMDDPEAVFEEGALFCDIGNTERGLGLVRQAVTKGYYVVDTMLKSPAFQDVRDDPEFREILAEAEAGRARALSAFRARGGERLLGQPVAVAA
jgi:eukaryotic-like serine/threonine-protein kinase